MLAKLELLQVQAELRDNKTQKADLRDSLAAERTFLAWIRTGLALTGVGRTMRSIPASIRDSLDMIFSVKICWVTSDSESISGFPIPPMP